MPYTIAFQVTSAVAVTYKLTPLACCAAPPPPPPPARLYCTSAAAMAYKLTLLACWALAWAETYPCSFCHTDLTGSPSLLPLICCRLRSIMCMLHLKLCVSELCSCCMHASSPPHTPFPAEFRFLDMHATLAQGRAQESTVSSLLTPPSPSPHWCDDPLRKMQTYAHGMAQMSAICSCYMHAGSFLSHVCMQCFT